MTTFLGSTSHARTPTTPPRAGRRAWAALAVLVLPVLLISIDSTALGFAVPLLSESLRPSAAELLWIVDVYSFVLAGLLVTMGTLGDRIGRRRLLLSGAAGFGAASLLAAYATGPLLLIAARALLGVAGATLMPSTLSLIRNLFIEAKQRQLAVAVWGSAFAGGAALGPIVGGVLLEHFWWGSIFLINVPIVVVFLVLGRWLLPESRDPKPGRLDLVSVLLSLGTMFPAVYGIKELAEGGERSLAIGAIVVGLLLGAVFLRRQHRLADPLLQVDLLRERGFSVAVATNLLSVFALVGSLYFVTQYLQLVRGLSPVEAGLRLVPGLVVSVLTSLLAVVLVRRFRPPAIICAGLLVAAGGYLALVWLGAASGPGPTLVAAAFVLICAGIGLAETLTNDAVLAAVPADRAGAASAISETAYELGAALGTAVLGSVLAAVYRSGLHQVGGVPTDAMARARATLGGAGDAAAGLPATAGRALLRAADDAFTSGVHVVAVLGAAVMVYAAVQAAVLLRRRV